MKITADIKGLDNVRAALVRVGSAPKLALDQTAEDIEDYIGVQAGKHRVTGSMERTLTKVREGQGWFIGHRSPVALFVHWGTKPHLIMPRKKKVLRWAKGGKFVFAHGVKHPGYKGDPWAVRAAAIVPRTFQQHLQTILAIKD